MNNEKKYTRKENQSIVSEELRMANLNPVRELSTNELEAVSGGEKHFKTHEEIDAMWDIVGKILKEYDKDVALITAQELNLLPGINGSGNSNPLSDGQTGIERCRRYDHDALNEILANKNGRVEKWNTN